MSIDYDHATMNLLISLRAGFPDACDFCRQPFTDQRWPVPAEAGEWACTECEARWAAKEATRP